MRNYLIAGNWKMHGSKDRVQELLAGIKQGTADQQEVDVLVLPPHVYLQQAAAELQGSQVLLGAQAAATEQQEGAFTGETAATMLADIGCSHVLVGHSERRQYYGETNAVVAQKTLAARAAGLTPIVCVGESLEQREQDITEQIVCEQLNAVLDVLAGELQPLVLAYEPVWAIGTGKTATPEQAQTVHELLRAEVAKRDPSIAQNITILYGGSAKPDNAAQLFAMPDIDGGLIGGASLKANDFLAIIEAAKSC